MVKLIINNKNIEVDDNTTILEACELNNIYIPRLCYLKDINEVNACRVCLVEIEGVDELVPSCTTICENGMKIYTHSKKALDCRKNQVKFLLSNHNYNCAACNKNKACFLRKACEDLNISDEMLKPQYDNYTFEKKYPLIRDNTKCIKCGRCVNVCDKVAGMKVWDFLGKGNNIYIDVKDNKKYSKVDCSYCGQCVVNCPTNGLSSQDDTEKLIDAINDKDKVVVLQVAPAVRTAWAERLGLKYDNATIGKMVTAIKSLGVDYVFDTNYSADLTIMEEGSELFEFLEKRKDKLPMFTSCCPGWVRYMKLRHSDMIHNLSTSKSPQQMFGAITKTYFTKKVSIDPKNIFCVSVMPCIAKKYECNVKEVNASDEYNDVDLSITTRELDKLIKMYGIDVDTLKENNFDSPLGVSTGAGVIFGTTGGVMEAALRTAYYLTYNKNPDADMFSNVRGDGGKRFFDAKLGESIIKECVVYGLKNAEELIQDIISDKVQLDFVEVMACPNGCINGGGQPERNNDKVIDNRKNLIYNIDKKSTLRFSHENPEIITLYKDFLTKPLSELSTKLLHTDQSKWSL